jgi:SCY1-like protein 1
MLTCVFQNYGAAVPDSGRYSPPEVAKLGWDVLKKNPVSAVDSYNYGSLIYETFNGPFTTTAQLVSPGSIPPTMQQGYKRLVNANPKARLSISHFLEQGRRSGGFFETPLIRVTDGIDSLGMKTEEERDQFLSEMEELSDDFPEELFKMKLLPELVKSVEFGGGGPKVFSAILKIAEKLSDDDFSTKVQPVIVRLFSIPDRGLRVAMLDALPKFISRLPQKVVSDQIFPQVVSRITNPEFLS